MTDRPPAKQPNPQSLNNALNSIENALKSAGFKNCGLASRSQHEYLLDVLNGALREAVRWIEERS